MKIRSSQLGKIMTNPTKKEMENGEVLSKGAKTYLRQIAKERFFKYQSEIDSKYLDKGNQSEPDSIALYNAVNFSSFKKNTDRKSNDFLTGECDIETKSSIIDVKSCWSLETFPATIDEAMQKQNASMYEWQGRAYMMLYDKDFFDLAYTIVSTPIELLKDWDNHSIHLVDHIAPEHRLTVVRYKRDKSIEDDIKAKCVSAIEYVNEVMNQIQNK